MLIDDSMMCNFSVFVRFSGLLFLRGDDGGCLVYVMLGGLLFVLLSQLVMMVLPMAEDAATEHATPTSSKHPSAAAASASAHSHATTAHSHTHWHALNEEMLYKYILKMMNFIKKM